MFTSKFVIGVIHLPRLPSTLYRAEGLEQVVERAVSEAMTLEELGFSGVLVENYGDYPYEKRVLDPLTISAMSIVVREVVKSVSIPVGLNLLRNSGREAYAIAIATGARFIRVNALTETLVTDSGILEPEAPLLRVLRANYPGISVFGDVMCKHGVSLNTVLYAGTREDAVRVAVEDLVERGGADYVVVTGARTGEAPGLDMVSLVKRYSSRPVVIGSGSNPGNLGALLSVADGVIVGSYIRVGGRAGNPLDPARARAYISAFKSATG